MQVGERISKLTYIRMDSGARQEIAGPLESLNFGHRVFAFPADREKLTKLLKAYPLNQASKPPPLFEFKLRDPSKGEFPWKKNEEREGSVLMLVSSFDRLTGKGEKDHRAPVRRLQDRAVTFLVPVWCCWKDTKQHALLPLYTFAEANWNVLTEYECNGRPAFKSLIESLPGTYIEGLKPEKVLWTVQTTLFPKFNKREQARLMPLMRIAKTEQNVLPGVDEAKEAVGDLLVINADATQRLPFVGLKQVRDAIEPDRASYQALVAVTRTIEGVSLPDKGGIMVDVEIHGYVSLDLVDTMGLIHEEKEPHVVGKARLYDLKALQGPMIAGTMRDQKTRNLCCWSNQNNEWVPDEDSIKSFFEQ